MHYSLKILCFLICLLAHVHTNGQSLKNLGDSVNNNIHTNIAKAGSFITEGLSLARKLKSDSALAWFADKAGIIDYKNGNYNAAINHYKSALSIWQRLKLHHQTISTLCNIGNAQEAKSAFTDAQQTYLWALALADSTKNHTQLASIYNNLGSIYQVIGHYTSAESYLKKSIALHTKLKNNSGLGYAYSNLGTFYQAQQNYDSAENYFNQAVKLFTQTSNLTELAGAYTNLGMLFTHALQYNKALDFLKQSLELNRQLKNVADEAAVLTNIGVCLHDQKKYRQALTYFLQAEKITEKLEAPNLLADIYYNISSAYEETGNMRLALTYSQQYADLKDTLFTRESNRLISEMRQKYEAEQSEKQISQLQTERALQQSEITVKTQQRNIILLSATLILILLGLAAYSYRQKLLQNKAAALKAEQENRQAIEKLLKEQEIKSINAMIQGQEQERQRVAEDLHDRLGSLLSTVKLNFSGLERKMEPVLQGSEQYKKGINLLDEACSEVRKIAYNMASGVLQKYGFITSVEELAKSIESSGNVKMNLFAHNTEIPLDKESEINLYRITQELISNILRHAGATEINLHFNVLDDMATLIVEDNGIGFNTSAKSKGMGIRNMQARVNKLDGTIDFDSAPGRGTTVVICVPVKEKAFLQTNTETL